MRIVYFFKKNIYNCYDYLTTTLLSVTISLALKIKSATIIPKGKTYLRRVYFGLIAIIGKFGQFLLGSSDDLPVLSSRCLFLSPDEIPASQTYQRHGWSTVLWEKF